MAEIRTSRSPAATGRRSPTTWWPLAAITLAVFMLMLDVTIVTVALPAMGRDLHVGGSGLPWVMNAYTLSMAAVQLTAGALADRFGHRRLFVASITSFAVASLACGLAPDVTVLLVGRVAQGLAGAFMFATTLALIARTYVGNSRDTAFAVRGIVAGLAVVLGPVVGGFVTDELGWRWIFFVNVPVAAVAAAIGRRRLPVDEAAGRTGRFDVVGPVLLAVSSAALVGSLISSGGRGWTDRLIVAGFALAAVTLAVFVLVQRRVARPTLALHLFARARFVGTQIGSFSVQAGVFALVVYLSLYFQGQLGLGVLAAGVAFLPLLSPIIVAGALVGPLQGRLPTRVLVGGSLLVITLGLALMRGITPQTGLGHLIPGMIVTGLGCGIVLPVLGSLAVGADGVEPELVGMASGVNNSVLQLGFTLGVAVYGSVLARAASPTAFAEGLDRALGIGAGTALAGSLLTLLLLRGSSRGPQA